MLVLHHRVRTGLGWQSGKGLVPPGEHAHRHQRARAKGLPLEPSQSLGDGRLEVHEPKLGGRLPKLGQMLRKGGTALEAADNVHSDLARGFIRAETMKYDDLVRLGSEREIKAHNLMRQEPKDYVVQEGDILHIRFNV